MYTRPRDFTRRTMHETSIVRLFLVLLLHRAYNGRRFAHVLSTRTSRFLSMNFPSSFYVSRRSIDRRRWRVTFLLVYKSCIKTSDQYNVCNIALARDNLCASRRVSRGPSLDCISNFANFFSLITYETKVFHILSIGEVLGQFLRHSTRTRNFVQFFRHSAEFIISPTASARNVGTRTSESDRDWRSWCYQRSTSNHNRIISSSN